MVLFVCLLAVLNCALCFVLWLLLLLKPHRLQVIIRQRGKHPIGARRRAIIEERLDLSVMRGGGIGGGSGGGTPGHGDGSLRTTVAPGRDSREAQGDRVPGEHLRILGQRLGQLQEARHIVSGHVR